MAKVHLLQRKEVKSIAFRAGFEGAINKKNKILLVTHRDCMDGYMCAYLAHIALKDVLVDIILTTYGNKQEDDIGNKADNVDVVIFADMTPSEVVFKKLAERNKAIFIFDHHPNDKFSTSIYRDLEHDRLIEDNYYQDFHYPFLLLNINYSKSGAYLLYEELALQAQLDVRTKEKLTQAFNLTAIVSDQDTHSLNVEGSQEFVGMVFTEIQRQTTLVEKLKVVGKYVDVANTYALDDICLGNLTDYISYSKQKELIDMLVKEHADRAYCVDATNLKGFVTSHEFVCYVLFGHYDYRSKYLEAIATKHKDSEKVIVVAAICPDKGVSIRSTDHGLALKLAAAFGGGGHPNAAGIPIEKMVEFTNWTLEWQIDR